MTREEAIAILEDNKPSIIFEDEKLQKETADLCVALNMAIHALGQEYYKVRCTLDDFKKFAVENNYALLTTELYSQMITERAWMKPKDALPTEWTRVLVTIKTRSRIVVRSGMYYDGRFSLDNGDCWLTSDKEVVAWMKLPEPYGYERKAESEDEK